MYERFTDRARKVMLLANQEAQRFNHEYIGTEHVLLGLIKEGSGVAANVLKNLDIDLRKIRTEVEKLVQSGPDMVTMGKLPQTPRAKRVIEFAMLEAHQLNHTYVGTEHMLLGLLREVEGVAAQVLMNLGLKLNEVRKEVLVVLGKMPPGARPLSEPSPGLLSQFFKRRRPTKDRGENPKESANYERFTDRGRKVLALANQEAQRFNHEYIGTEHLLLGLIKEGSGVAANVLRNLDIDLRKIRLEVEKLVQSGPDMVMMGRLPETPRAKKSLEYAVQEATALNHNYVGTEHILLGLLREEEGVAAQVLVNLGLTLSGMRAEVLNLLGRGPATEQTRLPVTAGLHTEISDIFSRTYEVARLRGEKPIAAGHLFLGMLSDPSGIAARALAKFGVDIDKLAEEIVRLMEQAPKP